MDPRSSESLRERGLNLEDMETSSIILASQVGVGVAISEPQSEKLILARVCWILSHLTCMKLSLVPNLAISSWLSQ